MRPGTGAKWFLDFDLHHLVGVDHPQEVESQESLPGAEQVLAHGVVAETAGRGGLDQRGGQVDVAAGTARGKGRAAEHFLAVEDQRHGRSLEERGLAVDEAPAPVIARDGEQRARQPGLLESERSGPAPRSA